MKRLWTIMFVLGVLVGSSLSIFFGQEVGLIIGLLVQLFLAVFFGGALGNVALGILIGILSGLLLSRWATAVFRRAQGTSRDAKQQPNYGVL